MKFDFCIGNPPYQDETVGDNETYAPPVYNKFLDSAYEIADKVEMIHPARFLFNNGSTPKNWNKKMLEDEHLKVLEYQENSKDVFSNTEIKGGIAITYRDSKTKFGAIGTYTPYDELNSIIRTVESKAGFSSLSEIVISSYAYHFTEKMHADFPTAKDRLSKGHAYDLKSNTFLNLPDVLLNEEPENNYNYVKVVGRENNQRISKYIRSDYITAVPNLYKYKVFLSSANGNGVFGETLTPPFVVEPRVASTETFLSIGLFDDEISANNLLKYIQTKFARALLGALKKTHHITVETWNFVPLQDFTQQSDIDWSKTIPEIDHQLYKKYGLSKEEIDFVETNVKEME